MTRFKVFPLIGLLGLFLFPNGSLLAQNYEFKAMIPSQTDNRMNRPESIALDSKGRIYVGDTKTNSIFVFDDQGQQVEVITELVTESGTIKIKDLVDLYVDRHDNLYILDADRNQVLVKPAAGYPYSFGESGRGLGELDRVRSIAVDSEGYIYVLNGRRKQVDIFFPNGQYYSWISGVTSNFDNPVAIGINAGNQLYVLDEFGPNLYIFDVHGTLVFSQSSLSGRPGVAIDKAVDLAVLPGGDFLILDGKKNRLTHFTRPGEVLGTFGSKGSSAKGLFKSVKGIATSPSIPNEVAILDDDSKLSQVFKLKTSGDVAPETLNRIKIKPIQTEIRPPSSLVVAPNGSRYMVPADYTKKIIAYADTSSRELFNINAVVGDAVDLATDENSNIYALDAKSKEVYMFDSQGVLIRKFGSEIPQKLSKPRGIATLSTGEILVVDQGRNLVQMWNSQGIYQKVLIDAQNSVLEEPRRILVSSKDEIFLWDTKLNAVLKFAKNGNPDSPKQLRLRTENPEKQEGEILGVAIDALDQLHVFNKSTSQYEIYTWETEPLQIFSYGRPGSGTSGFNKVETIALDPVAFIAHVAMDKVKTSSTFQFIIQPPSPQGQLSFSVSDDGYTKISFPPLESKAVKDYVLLDLEGKVIAENDIPEFTLSGQQDSDVELHTYSAHTRSVTAISDDGLVFEDYLGKGNVLFNQGKYDEAFRVYRKSLEAYGTPVDIVTYIAGKFTAAGQVLADNYQLKKAMIYLRAGQQLAPESEVAMNGLAYGYRRLINQFALNEDYDSITEEGSRAQDFPVISSIVYSTIDSLAGTLLAVESERTLQKSVEMRKKLVEWQPENATYVLGLADSDFALYSYKKNTGAPSFELAVLLSEAEKFIGQAVASLKTEQKPYAQPFLLQLKILNAGNKFSQVEELVISELQQSSGLDKQDEIFLRKQLALAYAGLEKNDLSVLEYQRILSLDSENLTYQLWLAEAYIDAGNYDEAKLLYQQLLFNDRENATYLAAIGRIELMKGNYSEASFQLEKAIKTDATNRSWYGYLAQAFDGSSNFQKALENYKIALQYEEQRLSSARARMSSSEEVREIQDKITDYNNAMAKIYEQLGQFKNAIVSYEQVLQLNQANSSAWYGLGTANQSAGLVYDAIKAFNTALKLEPTSELYANALSSARNLRDQIAKNQPPLNIVELRINEVFPSLYKNYGDISLQPVGEIVLANNTPLPITPNQIMFSVKGYMDEATIQTAGSLVGFSNTTFKLAALFNESLLELTEDKTVQATVVIKYTDKGEEKTATKTVPFLIHGRNAITWKDKRRLAAFVSTNTEVIIDYVKTVNVQLRNAPTYGLNKQILQAMKLYTALNKSDFTYTPDPEQSFALVTTQTDILDFLQFPAETLVRKSGDCDDLVAVSAGLLENAGVATAYVDVPGHVFLAFDSGIEPKEIVEAGLDPKDVMVQYGKVWIPIETTLLGTQDFFTAWQSAADRYYDELNEGHFPEIVPLADAREVYKPSTFVPKSFDVVPPSVDQMEGEYLTQVRKLLNKTNAQVLTDLKLRHENEPNNLIVKNRFATLNAQLGDLDKAEQIIREGLEISPSNAALLNNLGNIQLQKKYYDLAVQSYLKALENDQTDAEIQINLVKAYLALGKKAKAREAYQAAITQEEKLKELYDFMEEWVK